MAPPPRPYSGTSTLALAHVSAFSLGLVYGSAKLKYLQKFSSQKIERLKISRGDRTLSFPTQYVEYL
ncbi:ATPase [Salix suchowensis]|nr:ATPase [Salix suchowensis]